MRTWKAVSLVVIVSLLATAAWFVRSESRFARYKFRVGTPKDETVQLTFLEERVRVGRFPFFELNELAALYASRGKWTGDESWYDKAEATALRSLALVPKGNLAPKLVQAEVAFARHSFKDGLRLANEALAEAPNSEPALILLVTGYLAIGEYTEAIRHADRLAHYRPLPSNFALRAVALSSVGRDDEAAFDFDRALAVEDFGAPRESAWVRALYGRFLLRHGETSRAKRALREAARIHPQSHLAFSLLGENAALTGDWSEADRHFARAFELSPQARYLRGRAVANAAAGKTALAADLRTQAERMVRDDLTRGRFGHRLDLIPLLLDKGDESAVKEALALAEQESQTRRSHDALFWLATAQLQAKSAPAARETLRELLLQGERRAEFFELASRVEGAMGNRNRAAFYKKKARDTNPKAVIPGQELGVTAAVG